jgi:hypothetical protein
VDLSLSVVLHLRSPPPPSTITITIPSKHRGGSGEDVLHWFRPSLEALFLLFNTPSMPFQASTLQSMLLAMS